jgi:hypothetical protein
MSSQWRHRPNLPPIVTSKSTPLPCPRCSAEILDRLRRLHDQRAQLAQTPQPAASGLRSAADLPAATQAGTRHAIACGSAQPEDGCYRAQAASNRPNPGPDRAGSLPGLIQPDVGEASEWTPLLDSSSLPEMGRWGRRRWLVIGGFAPTASRGRLSSGIRGGPWSEKGSPSIVVRHVMGSPAQRSEDDVHQRRIRSERVCAECARRRRLYAELHVPRQALDMSSCTAYAARCAR